MLPPDLYVVGYIWGEIDDAIHLPFAPIDTYRPSGAIHGVPREGTHLRDPQPTPQHQEEDEPVTDGVNDLKKGSQVRVRYRFGQHGRRQQPMATTHDWLLRHLAFLAQILKETGQDTQLGINGGRHQPRRLGGSDERGDILGGRLCDIIGEHHLTASRQMTDQRVEGRDHGAQGRVGILTGGETGKVMPDAVLILRTEASERRLILCRNRAIHRETLHVVTA